MSEGEANASVDIKASALGKRELEWFSRKLGLDCLFLRKAERKRILTYRHAFKVVSSTFNHKFSNNVKF